MIAHGAISVYEARGQYQFYVDHLEPAGVGRLWLEFERLKARLAAEGLFDEAANGPSHPCPAAGHCDLSHGSGPARHPAHACVALPAGGRVLAPTPVQGEYAPPRIVAAIEALNRWSVEREPLDAILLARGGGSIEELWAFNDERVARAILASAFR